MGKRPYLTTVLHTQSLQAPHTGPGMKGINSTRLNNVDLNFGCVNVRKRKRARMKGKVHKGFKLPSLASKTKCINIIKEENGCSSDAQPN